MFLLIFESLGTSELILIGIVALIFLGPRKLPLMARKIGKIMAEFRSTAGEFRETWSREVNFEEEAKLLQLNRLEEEAASVATEMPKSAQPRVKEMDPEEFRKLQETASGNSAEISTDGASIAPAENERANWL
jgi:sec-independent protein translocase protein TatB